MLLCCRYGEIDFWNFTSGAMRRHHIYFHAVLMPNHLFLFVFSNPAPVPSPAPHCVVATGMNQVGFEDADSGHFTQVVWTDTTKVLPSLRTIVAASSLQDTLAWHHI